MSLEYEPTEKGYDSSAFLPSPSFEKLMSIHEEHHKSYKLIVANQTEFVDFSTKFYAKGYDICAFSPDSNIGIRFSSPLLRTARLGVPDPNWIEKYRKFKEEAGDDKPCMIVDLKPDMTNFLRRVERRLGLEALPETHDAILNMGAFHIAEIFDMTREGFLIAAFTNALGEKIYSPWESEFNTRYDRLVENAMIDTVQDFKRVEIKLPFDLAA